MASGNSQAASGDQTAAPIDWSAVWVKHGRWLRTVVLARVADCVAADEVLQEVAMAVVAHRAPLADPAKLAPWLYRIAVRQSLLFRRRRGRQRRLMTRYGELVQISEDDPRSPDPLEWLVALERRGLIRQAIERLPPRDVEILLLKYTEEWSYRELAAHLGISQSALEARLHRARQRLRHELTTLDVLGATQ